MNLLPIGSVIAVNGHELCVVGYTSIRKDDTVTCGYYTVPYPLGYIGIEKLFFIPHATEMTVLATGYEDEMSKNLLQVLEGNFTIGEAYPTLDPAVIVQKYKDAIDKRRENEQ